MKTPPPPITGNSSLHTWLNKLRAYTVSLKPLSTPTTKIEHTDGGVRINAIQNTSGGGQSDSQPVWQ